MELRQLRYFIAVVQAKSFSRAAVDLHIAQSALSRQIKNLEKELGVTLLIRGVKNLSLTDAGNLLFERALAVTQDLSDVTRELLAHPNVPKGNLRIGVLTFTGELLMPRILPGFTRKYPDVRIHLRSGVSSFINDWLQKDQIDIGILDSSRAAPNLISEKIAQGRMVVVLPSPEACKRLGVPQKKLYEVDDLRHVPLILTSAGHTQRNLIEKAASDRGFTPKIALEADNISTITACVRAGVGCTVLAYSAIHNAVMRGEVRTAPLVNPEIFTDISIITRSGSPVTAAMQSMISHIKQGIWDLAENDHLPEQSFRIVTRRPK